MMEKKRVIIDTDPGVDDVNAILFALLSDQFEIEAITTVHGNVDVDTGTRNALYMVERFSDKDIPVYRGAARSMVGGLPKDATILHGDDGMGNTGLAKPTLKRQDESGVSALIRHVMEAPEEITLLVLGPQTNIALAIRSEPDFASAVKEIIFMGGRITPRVDTNPYVTFNIGEDPEAANIVLQETNIPTTMLGQETAMQIIFTPETLQEFESLNTESGYLAAKISKFYVEQQMRLMDAPGGSIPDIAVIAYALRPELFNQCQIRIEVDVSDGPGRGGTYSGLPSYMRYQWSDLEKAFKGRPPISKDVPDPRGDLFYPVPEDVGRTINTPTWIDADQIVDWYTKILAKK
jgi:inosine-uridine nucleoside N-ribohydrolase